MSPLIDPDGIVHVSPSVYMSFYNRGICFTCRMKHTPFCNDGYVGCRNCLCGKEWHPMDGPCRVGPETEFTVNNCHCPGYVPLDNLQYLEWKFGKLEGTKK